MMRCVSPGALKVGGLRGLLGIDEADTPRGLIQEFISIRLESPQICSLASSNNSPFVPSLNIFILIFFVLAQRRVRFEAIPVEASCQCGCICTTS